MAGAVGSGHSWWPGHTPHGKAWGRGRGRALGARITAGQGPRDSPRGGRGPLSREPDLPHQVSGVVRGERLFGGPCWGCPSNVQACFHHGAWH